jgi:hypothetical protein
MKGREAAKRLSGVEGGRRGVEGFEEVSGGV